jgi:hypothetical protein
MGTFTYDEGRETGLQMVRTVMELVKRCQQKAENYTFFLIEPYQDPRMKHEELMLQRLKCLYEVVKNFIAIFRINRVISSEDDDEARKLYNEYVFGVLEIKILY